MISITRPACIARALEIAAIWRRAGELAVARKYLAEARRLNLRGA